MRWEPGNRSGSEFIKNEVVHWLMGKGDSTYLVSRKKNRLVKKRQGKTASGFGILFHQIVKFL